MNSYRGPHSTQDTNGISEYEIAMRLNNNKNCSWARGNTLLGFQRMFNRVIPSHNSNDQFVIGVWELFPEHGKRHISVLCPKLKTQREYSGYADLRPISLTPIISRLIEKIVVTKYLWPSMNNEQMSDQFAFKPTGSTTAAIIELLHIVLSMLDQGNDYVRCIIIDYSKAFDVVNHEILLQELCKLAWPD